MKAILLDEAKKWLEENCENLYTRMAVFGLMQSMPTVDYQEEPNEPLTLDQLREMDGEPVYIHSDIFPEDCGWRVIARADVLRIYFTDRTSLSLTDYGKSWIAYRRPPEGEVNA